MQEWITIKQAQEKVANYSDRKYRQLIDDKKITGTKGGKGANRLINYNSLVEYFKGLSQTKAT